MSRVRYVVTGHGSTPEMALTDARNQAENKADASLEAVRVGGFTRTDLEEIGSYGVIRRLWEVEVMFE